MFGYFGKGNIAPLPGAPIPAEEEEEEEVAKGPPRRSPRMSPTMTSSRPRPRAMLPRTMTPRDKRPSSDDDDDGDEFSSRLREFREAIAARKEEKTSQIEALRDRQARQAAYGRGETSKGKRSESEIAIGVSSGYYGYDHRFGHFGQLEAEITAAGQEVAKATRAVESTTQDLKKGFATESELQTAMEKLAEKTRIAKELTAKTGQQLKGYGEMSGKAPRVIAIAVALSLLAWWISSR